MSPARFRSLLAVAGILALLAGLVVHFPARLAFAWFAPPALQAWGVEGTVWTGRAAELSYQQRSLGGLTWEARPATLLRLRPAWRLGLRNAGGYARGELAVSLLADRQELRDFEASLELASLPPALVPTGTAGQARVSLDHVILEDGWPARLVGRAAVANLDLPGVIITLGPFEFLFPDTQGTPVGQLRSLGGPLEVEGRIELPGPGRWVLDAELAPGEDPPRELVEGLVFVGEDLGDGRRRFYMSSEP